MERTQVITWRAWFTLLAPLIVGLASGAGGAYISLKILESRVSFLEKQYDQMRAQDGVVEDRVRTLEVWHASAPEEAEQVKARQQTVIANQNLIMERLSLMRESLRKHMEEPK